MTGADGAAGQDARSQWRWDVALSFAGAQRPYVEQVASALKARGVRCFYDADEQIELWGKYLAEELPAIYGEQAAAVVVFVSAEYAARDWTRLERRAALNRAVRERREYVLPARFDDTPLPGLLSDMVAVDLRGRTPQQFVAMIADKLARLAISASAPSSDAAGPARDVEPAYRATLRQLRARTGMLQGRSGELAAIGAFATGRPSLLAPPGSQHSWLVGGPWAGKTALLAEAVHVLPPEVDCVAYFLIRPIGDADRERFLVAVVLQLAWLLGTDPPSPLDEHVFRQLWERAAQRAADQGRQLLLIVDGLDEDLRPGGHSVAGWLPGRLPGLPARVLVASRRYPRLPDDVDPAHPLAALAPDERYTLPDSPHAARLRELADQEITQLLRWVGDDLVLDVLGLLTAARGGPLAAADLATLTGSRPWQVRGSSTGRQRGPCSRSDRRTRRATPSLTRRCSTAASNKVSVIPAIPAASTSGRRPGRCCRTLGVSVAASLPVSVCMM
jgi:TIR domain